MKQLHLVFRNLTRKPVRSFITLLAISVAFFLFAYLGAIRLAFGMGVDVAGVDRLLVIHKVSLILQMPESYVSRLEAIPGVEHVAHATWFGGKFQDRENRFAIMPVEPERFLELYTEFLLPEEQKKAWIETRTGAIVGRQTAERYDMKIGDRVPIQGTIYRKADGGDTWEFDIVGIYDGAEAGVDDSQFFFQYDYFNEARSAGKDTVGWFGVRIDDPENAAAVAEKIDATFANSSYETETSTEKAFVQGFAKQVGNIGAILRAVLTAVFFTMLLVAGNTMAQSVRERIGELAVLKTLGFSDLKVLGIVLTESLLLALVGGLAGLGAGWLFVQTGDPTGGYLPIFHLPPKDLAIGVVLVVVLGVAAGLLPAVQAMRLRIVDALRRV